MSSTPSAQCLGRRVSDLTRADLTARTALGLGLTGWCTAEQTIRVLYTAEL